MAATNFQAEIPAFLPLSGQFIQLVNKPAQIPGIGFNIVSDPATYPSSGTPAAPSNGIGSFSVTTGLITTGAAGPGVSHYIWVAPAACQLIVVYFAQTVIEATSATTTLQFQKVPSGGAGVNLLAAALNAKTGVVANTTTTPALTATAANLIFAATDQLELVITNSLTEYLGSATLWFNFI